MEIRRLRHFLALAEEANFTRAARRELIVQSGLSASIRALERDVGAALFVRGTRPVRLTAEGSALVPAARRALRAADDAAQAVRDVHGVLAGELRLGALHANGSACPFSTWLVTFTAQHPGLNVSVQQMPAVEMLDSVSTGALDCAIASAVPGRTSGLQVIPLVAEPLVLICAPAHPFAGSAHLDLDLDLTDLAAERFVEMHRGWATRLELDMAFAEIGVDRHIACEVNEWSLVLDLVAAGMGVAFVPQSLVDERQPSARTVHRVPVRADLRRRLDLVLPSGEAASPAARRFADHVRSRRA